MLASASSWTSLPADVSGIVFAHLPPRDLLAAAGVCHAWHRAAAADIVWTPHLAARVALHSEAILTMQQRGVLAPLGLRDQYALCVQMGSRSMTYSPETGRWTSADSASRLEVIRDATQLGFNPLRHTAPSWANALRLMRLWAVCGTRAVAAVAATCGHATLGRYALPTTHNTRHTHKTHHTTYTDKT